MKWTKKHSQSFTRFFALVSLLGFTAACGSDGCADIERYDACLEAVESDYAQCEADEVWFVDACYWRERDYNQRYSTCGAYCEEEEE